MALVMVGAIVTGCGPRKTPPPVATAAPGGRGVSNPSPRFPRSVYEQSDVSVGSAQPQAASSAGPIKTFDDKPAAPASHATTVDSAAAVPTKAGFVGKVVTVHLTQGSLALGSGPRHDLVKGKVASIDAEWLVIESDEGKTLHIPRATVLAIEEQK